jgi:hypothetical protein
MRLEASAALGTLVGADMAGRMKPRYEGRSRRACLQAWCLRG